MEIAKVNKILNLKKIVPVQAPLGKRQIAYKNNNNKKLGVH